MGVELCSTRWGSWRKFPTWLQRQDLYQIYVSHPAHCRSSAHSMDRGSSILPSSTTRHSEFRFLYIATCILEWKRTVSGSWSAFTSCGEQWRLWDMVRGLFLYCSLDSASLGREYSSRFCWPALFFSSSCLPGDIYATTEEERVRFAELSPDFLGHAAGSETRDILRCQEWCFSDTFHAVTFHRCSI